MTTVKTMYAYTFHQDPGHGWLEVSMAESNEVGLLCDAYSAYSYVKGTALFLEEDCDAPKFIAAFKAKHGHEPRIVERHTNTSSPIRNYARIHS